MTEDQHVALLGRVRILEDGHKSLAAGLKANTELTEAVKSDTSDLVEFTKAVKGLVTLSRWLGKAIQWLAPIALVMVSWWAVVRGKSL